MSDPIFDFESTEEFAEGFHGFGEIDGGAPDGTNLIGFVFWFCGCGEVWS